MTRHQPNNPAATIDDLTQHGCDYCGGRCETQLHRDVNDDLKAVIAPLRQFAIGLRCRARYVVNLADSATAIQFAETAEAVCDACESLALAKEYLNVQLKRGQEDHVDLGGRSCVEFRKEQAREIARLRTQIECDARDPAHENCRNLEAQRARQLEVEMVDTRKKLRAFIGSVESLERLIAWLKERT